MNLAKFTIINYKSCQLLDINLDINQPNIFIGINDSGKSSVLKAIELFFENKTAYFNNDKSIRSDLSNTPVSHDKLNAFLNDRQLPEFNDYSTKEIILLAKFGIEETIEDASVTEQLAWALGHGQELWIAKIFTENSTTGSYKLLSKDCNNKELWNNGEKSLEEEMNTLKLSNKDTTNTNKKGKPTKIERIRAIYNADPAKLQFVWCDYDLKKDRETFPSFSLFNWNSDLEDLKKIVADTMRDNIADIQKAVFEKAREASIEATKAINAQLEDVTRDFIDELPGITKIKANIGFNVASQTTDILVEKNNADGMIHIESQGDGIKRQIWYVLMKWISNKKIAPGVTTKKVIWGFDEPETHLYPSAQRDFISSLDKLSSGSYQTIVATHSTIFVDKSRLNNVNKVFLNDKYSEITGCTGVVDIYEVLQLKNSDFLFYDKFLAVEGPTEFSVIPYFYQLDSNMSLMESNVQLINLKGQSNWKHNKSILDELVENFGETQKLLYYLLDNDTQCQDDNITLIGVMDFEDSLPNSLWLKILSDIYPESDINENDLQVLRSQISDKPAKKFYKLLNDLLHNRSKGAIHLPGKGEDLGSCIKKHVTNTEIPAVILEIFKKLK